MPETTRNRPETSGRKAPAGRRSPKRGLFSKLLALVAESFPKLTRLLKLGRDWTRRKPVWVRIPLYAVLLLGAAIYGFGDSLLKLPVVASVHEEIADRVKGIFEVSLPRASGKEFAIAVARIEDDDGGSVGKSLALALKISGVERLQIDRRLRFVDASNLDAAEAGAHQTARAWLDETGADILLWGQTIPGEPRGVRLIMTLRNADRRHEARLTQRYLAFNFLEQSREPFEAAVQAQVLGFLAQFDSSRAVAEQLRQAIARLQRFVISRDDRPGRGALVFALANAQATLGEQAGDNEVLNEAVTTYHQLLDARQRQAVPLDWAMTQNNLGNALCSLGKREAGAKRLEDAVKAYRAALEEYTPEKTPVEWAMTQNSLGHALETLGRRESESTRLVEALGAYRAALSKLDPKVDAADRALVGNNLGNALVALGEREDGSKKLEEAIQIYREALSVRSRKRMPLSWAMTQTNLGNALSALGEREKGTARLTEAVKAYRDALQEYTFEKVPLHWALAQNNLGAALARLGERETGLTKLQEAAAVFRTVLERRAKEKAPLSWAMTQRNLGNVLRSLGEREKSAARLEQAIAAQRSALEEYTRERAPLDWALTHNDLGQTLRILAEREKSPRRMDEAMQAFESALKVPELKSVPRYRAMVQENFWKAGALQAELGKTVGAER